MRQDLADIQRHCTADAVSGANEHPCGGVSEGPRAFGDAYAFTDGAEPSDSNHPTVAFPDAGTCAVCSRRGRATDQD